MLDAVTFDLEGVSLTTFALPDTSGLAPLSLPSKFLGELGSQPQTEPSSGSVRRFEAAMSSDSQSYETL